MFYPDGQGAADHRAIWNTVSLSAILALMKSLQLHKPHVIAVVGLPGSGKSFFAAQFSDTFHAPYLDFHRCEELAGDARNGQKIAAEFLDQLLRTGQTIVIEGRGDNLADRKRIANLARKNGYDTLFVWVQTDPVVASRRAAKTSRLSPAEFEGRANEFELLTRGEHYVVISGKHTYSTQAKVVLKRLVANRPTAAPGSIQALRPSRDSTPRRPAAG